MIIGIKIDLTLDNQQRLIYHKSLPTNQPTNQPTNSSTTFSPHFFLLFISLVHLSFFFVSFSSFFSNWPSSYFSFSSFFNFFYPSILSVIHIYNPTLTFFSSRLHLPNFIYFPNYSLLPFLFISRFYAFLLLHYYFFWGGGYLSPPFTYDLSSFFLYLPLSRSVLSLSNCLSHFSRSSSHVTTPHSSSHLR